MRQIALVILIAISSTAMGEDFSSCFDDAAAKEHVDVKMLKSIAWHESHWKASATHHNNDNSTDYGLMQINSSLLPYLNRYGITVDQLLNDPCLNIHIGAWVLKHSIQKYGYTWRAIGGYGAGYRKDKDGARQHYANQVAEIYFGTDFANYVNQYSVQQRSQGAQKKPHKTKHSSARIKLGESRPVMKDFQ